jgi:hypothetical protein
MSTCNEVACPRRGLVAQQNHPSITPEQKSGIMQVMADPLKPSSFHRRVCILDTHPLFHIRGHLFSPLITCPVPSHPPEVPPLSPPPPSRHPHQENRAKNQTPQGPARSSRRAALPYAPRISARQAFSGTFVAKPREGSGAHMAKVVTFRKASPTTCGEAGACLEKSDERGRSICVCV